MDEARSRHPYHMHNAIFAQPEAFVRVLEKNAAAVDEFAAGASSCERMFFTGIGTSYHAARTGEYLLREYGGGLDVRAIHAFDFSLYGPELASGDCVVALSHRGTKRYTASALRRAAAAHGQHEARIGQADQNWPDWYAEYMVREQAGEELPQ